MNNIRIALCQLNLTTGDFEGNMRKAQFAIMDKHETTDIFVFPECQVTNYPSDDLFGNKKYLERAQSLIQFYRHISKSYNTTLVFGAPYVDATSKDPRPYNAAIVVQNGEILGIVNKTALPNYDVFDDKRWFQQGRADTVDWTNPIGERVRLGIAICEDIWVPGVVGELNKLGAEIILSINSSPYSIAKAPFRRKVFENVVHTSPDGPNGAPLVYVNNVGGNDELVWDGCSAALDAHGNLFESQPWAETVDVVEFTRVGYDWQLVSNKAPVVQDFAEERYMAACIGLRDYVNKTGFRSVTFGNSGGADSCLVALMTADVFGPENCLHIMMPSQYTSEDSNSFAKDLADGLGAGAPSQVVPIRDQFNAFEATLAGAFGTTSTNVAEENLQAQLRGDILSWVSNKFGHMIISTGNKSELAMGYATLYGDMRGGFNPLKDLYKHKDVFELLRWRLEVARGNATFDLFEPAFGKLPVAVSVKGQEAVADITDRPPSAELAPGQKDSDNLPEYDVLDPILWELIDAKESQTHQEIADKLNVKIELVDEVDRRMRVMEYKRFQACPGPKIHRKAFTKKDWRMPMASKFRGV